MPENPKAARKLDSDVSAFISTRHINGWSIRRALDELDQTGMGWSFFTEERSLLEALRANSGGRRFKPAIRPDLVDDKWAFYQWLASIGERVVPTEIDLQSCRNFPVVLKGRHSWFDGKKLPRGWVCQTASDLVRRRDELQSIGLRPEWFMLQEYLGSEAQCVSVSGYFDSRQQHRTLLMVSRKVMTTAGSLPTGTVVEIISDPASLVQRAESVLSALDYDGPFEFEFIRKREDGDFMTLELNPRFWMQHGLLGAASDNGLLKRYLDLDTETDWKKAHVVDAPSVWINAIEALGDAVRGDFRILRKALWYSGRGSRVLFVPDWSVAIRYLAARLWRKMGKNIGLSLF